jgi:3-oxoacyl-[acyl-carrier-protein] synthase-1
MTVWIGAETMITPFGLGAENNFNKIINGETSIKKNQIIHGSKKPVTASVIEWLANSGSDNPGLTKIESISVAAINDCLSFVNQKHLGKTLFILSTTKGDIEKLNSGLLEEARPSYLCNRLLQFIPFKVDNKTISMACISGLLSIIHATDLIKAGEYESVFVLGADLVSGFTLSGFESFFALSPEFCKPYDKDRDGLNLGEAAAAVLLSKNKNVFKTQALVFEGGASSNDANHISGPSRTGEGLVRAIDKALNLTGTDKKSIDFISSHGTATIYNDDMESIAFNRCGLENISTSSFKGYFGHTLGAAGILEMVICMQSMRKSILPKNMGIKHNGTVSALNILHKNKAQEIKVILKTASGFGGCNAAGILKNPNLS